MINGFLNGKLNLKYFFTLEIDVSFNEKKFLMKLCFYSLEMYVLPIHNVIKNKVIVLLYT